MTTQNRTTDHVVANLALSGRVTTQTRITDHLVVNYSGISDSRVEDLIREAEDGHDKLVAYFDKEPYQFFNLHIYAFSGVPVPFALRGHVHLSTQRIGENAYNLLHEMTHAMLPARSATGSESAMIVEGFAVFVEEKFKPNHLGIPLYGGDTHKLAAELVPEHYSLNNVRQYFGTLAQSLRLRRIAYLMSGSFMRYLVEQYGVEKVIQYYENGKEEAVFGKSMETLETEWREFLRTLKGWRPATDPEWQAKTNRTQPIKRTKPSGALHGEAFRKAIYGNTVSHQQGPDSPLLMYEYFGPNGTLERWSENAPSQIEKSRWWVENGNLLCRNLQRRGAYACAYVIPNTGKLPWHRLDSVLATGNLHTGRVGDSP